MHAALALISRAIGGTAGASWCTSRSWRARTPFPTYGRSSAGYIEHHGKPVAFYSDKHSAFRNNVASANGDGMSHLGRALETLNIELICANSPQAKGRVERANGTLQDRLVKAMRLRAYRA